MKGVVAVGAAAKYHEIQLRMFIQFSYPLLQAMWSHVIIGVEENYVFPPSQSKTSVAAGLGTFGFAFPLYYVYSPISDGILLKYIFRLFVGTVVNSQKFPVLEGVCQDGVNHRLQFLGMIEDGHYDGKSYGSMHRSPSMLSNS